MQNDLQYFQRRIAEEAAKEQSEEQPSVRAVHHELGVLYRQRLEAMQASSAIDGN